MGADLITAVLVKEHRTVLKWDKGHEVIDKMKWDDFPNYLTDLWGQDVDPDDPSPEDVEDFKLMVHGAVSDAENLIENGYRNLNVYENILGGYDLFVTGDMSWGDTPAYYDEFITVAQLKRVAAAIGFVDLVTGERQ